MVVVITTVGPPLIFAVDSHWLPRQPRPGFRPRVLADRPTLLLFDAPRARLGDVRSSSLGQCFACFNRRLNSSITSSVGVSTLYVSVVDLVKSSQSRSRSPAPVSINRTGITFRASKHRLQLFCKPLSTRLVNEIERRDKRRLAPRQLSLQARFPRHIGS